MSKPQAILFDCWNTLFYTESRPLALRLLASQLLHRRLSYALTKRFERSVMLAPEIDPTTTARSLLREFGLPLVPGLVAVVKRALLAADRQPYPDTFKVLWALRGRAKLGLITNTTEASFKSLRQEFKLDDYFDVIMTSYEAGVLKPDAQIFRSALEQLKVAPNKAVMVGDNPRDDVAAAEAVGMTGILIDRKNRHPKHARRITALSELPELISTIDTRI